MPQQRTLWMIEFNRPCAVKLISEGTQMYTVEHPIERTIRRAKSGGPTTFFDDERSARLEMIDRAKQRISRAETELRKAREQLAIAEADLARLESHATIDS